MKIEMFIAIKHIKERKRQSIMSTIGISIGIVVLLVSIAVANGLDKKMIDSILGMTAHISATNPELSIENYMDEKAELEKIEGVVGAMPKLSTQGIIKYSGNYGTFVSGVMIDGMLEDDLKNILKLDKKIVEGSLNFPNLKSIIVGKDLFEQIGGVIGTTVTLVSPEAKELNLEIVGVFNSGFYEYDSKMVIVPLMTAQILTEFGEIASSFDIRIKDVHGADKISKEIFFKRGLDTKTWGEQNRNLLTALALEKGVMILVLVMIVIVSCFAIGVVLNALVREKTKDIGILRSVGFSRMNILKIFLIEGMLLGAFGIFTGTVISSLIIWYLKVFSFRMPTDVYYLDKLPVDINIWVFLIVIASTMLVIFISSLFPAYKASNMRPVEALKYE